MKAAMRAALKECLGEVKKGLRHRRAQSYARGKGDGDESSGDSDGNQAGSGNLETDSRGTAGAEKALRSKVASAEASAHEEMQEAGNWREEEMQQFMRKRAKPKVRREGSIASTVASAKSGKGEKKG